MDVQYTRIWACGDRVVNGLKYGTRKIYNNVQKRAHHIIYFYGYSVL
jgi:hypothetical protein